MSTLQKIMQAPGVHHEGSLLLECLDYKTCKYMPDISYYRFKGKEEVIGVCDFLGYFHK